MIGGEAARDSRQAVSGQFPECFSEARIADNFLQVTGIFRNLVADGAEVLRLRHVQAAADKKLIWRNMEVKTRALMFS